MYSLDPDSIEVEDFNRVTWFSKTIYAKKSKLDRGVKLSQEERESNKFRSDVWISFLKDCYENSGVISKTSPLESIVEDQNISLTVHQLSIKIFNVVFHSIEFINFENNPTVLIANVQGN